MNFKTGIGKTGVALAAIVAIAMCILSLLFKPVEVAHIQYGICLPSPDSWDIDPFWSWVINTVLVGLITLLLFLINKSYNFIRSTEPALISLFLIMTCSSPWFTEALNTSVILCFANTVCLGIIFASYDTKNATQQLFVLGLVIGIGSMFQYAFLPMAFVYFLWALFMKVLRIKETLAFVTGILCPYWITLGFGWVRLSELHFPSLTPLFGSIQDHTDFLLLLAAITFASGAGFLVAIANSMKIYAGNSRVNAMNVCIYALGIASVICILADYDNLPAYVVTLFMACAVQMANICAVWNPKFPWLVTVVPSLIYIAIFVASIIF